MEVWKDIKGYECLYQVSNCGNVRSLDRYVEHYSGSKRLMKGRILKPVINPYGYFQLVLSKDGKLRSVRVNRIVAMAFIPNPKNKRTVNHINGVKTNNSVNNLNWMTYKEQLNHAFDTGLKNCDYLKKKVKIFKDDKVLLFDSLIEASKHIGCHKSSVSKAIRGKTKSAYGWKVEYQKEE